MHDLVRKLCLWLLVGAAIIPRPGFPFSPCPLIIAQLPSSPSDEAREGARFLHAQDPRLHTAPPIETLVAALKPTHGSIQKPELKLAAWVEYLSRLSQSPEAKEAFKQAYLSRYVIRGEEIPEGYYALQIRIAREQGHGTLTLDDSRRRQLAQTLIDDQKSTLSAWVDYLFSENAKDYPAWAKVWVLENVPKLGQFDVETKQFHSRTDGQVAPFPELNREALALLIEETGRYARNRPRATFPFAKAYAAQLASVSASPHHLKNTHGRWVTFPRGSSPYPLVRTLEGKNTGWCTVAPQMAQGQLSGGDFHVYYSDDADGNPTIPRIAIRMEGHQISEIRGTAKGQHLDSDIASSGVLESKLHEFGEEGKRYEKKARDMRRLTLIEKKHLANEPLSAEELRFLYEIDEPILGFGYQNDPRIGEIIAKRDLRKDLSSALGVKEHEVSLTAEEALRGGVKFHYGNLDLSALTSTEGLVLPERVGGDLHLEGLTSANLSLPKHVSGHLYLSGLASAEGLTLPDHVGGDLSLSGLTSAKGLIFPKYVGGQLHLGKLESAEALTLPAHVGGDLRLGKLTLAKRSVLPKYVGGKLLLDGLTSAEGLTLPEHVGGNLELGSLISAKSLIFPKRVGGDLHLWRLTSADDVTFPERVEGKLELDSLISVTGTTLPRYVGRDLRLPQLSLARELKLPEHVGGHLRLGRLPSAKGMTFPEEVGGDLELDSLLSANGLSLPKRIGGSLRLGNVSSVEGLALPEHVGGALELGNLISAQVLMLPKYVGGEVDLRRLRSADNLTCPEDIGGNLKLDGLMSATGLTLPKRMGGNLELNSLASAKDLVFPKNVGGDLYLNGLRSVPRLLVLVGVASPETVILPERVGGSLYLNGLTSAKGLVLPERVGRDLYLRRLRSAKGLNLPATLGGTYYGPR